MNKEKALKNQGLEFREDIKQQGGGSGPYPPRFVGGQHEYGNGGPRQHSRLQK